MQLSKSFTKRQFVSTVFSLITLCILAHPSQAQTLASATAPSPQASAACLEISTGTAETQIWPAGLTNPDYEDAKNHYYSAANADLTPACAVFPTSATEVSFVVRVLLKYPTVPFGVSPSFLGVLVPGLNVSRIFGALCSAPGTFYS
jgi:hypothetical protein